MNDQPTPKTIGPLVGVTALLTAIAAPLLMWLAKVGLTIFFVAVVLLVLALITFTVLMIIRNRAGE